MSKLQLPRMPEIRAELEADDFKLVRRKRAPLRRHASEGQMTRLPRSLRHADVAAPPLRKKRSLSGGSPASEISQTPASPGSAFKGSLPPLIPVSPGPVRAVKSEPITRSSPTSDVPEFPPVMSRSSSAPCDVTAQALMLSKRYKLEFHEVKWLLSALQKTRPDADKGAMTLATFGKFLQNAFDVKSVSDVSFENAYEQCGAASGPLDVDKLLQWYRINMFSIVAPLTADSTKWQSEELIRGVAEKFKLRVVEVGLVHKVFERFDIDKSGVIDYNEFEAMMRNLIGVSDATDLPRHRMCRFWNEIDIDGNGTVDFDEFTAWYLKYFTSENPHGDVLDAFYASYSPDVQRRKHVEDLNAEDFHDNLKDNLISRMPTYAKSRPTKSRTVN